MTNDSSASRRRLLRTVGIGGTVILAGCLGGGDGSDDESPDSEGPTPGGGTDSENSTPEDNSDSPPAEPDSNNSKEDVPTKLVPEDGDNTDFFGFSVAVSETTAVVGALLDEDPNGNNAGSAYVFNGSGGTWTQNTKLTPNDGNNQQLFGYSVAVSDDETTVIIGAPSRVEPSDPEFNSPTGATYVFDRSGSAWSQRAKLTVENSARESGYDNSSYPERLGTSTAISGDGTTVIIGASNYSSSSSSIYVFNRNNRTYAQQAILDPEDSSTDRDTVNAITESVAVSSDGTTAIVGASGVDDQTGAAYVFIRDSGTWSQRAKLTADDRIDKEFFGRSVAVSGDGRRAIITAPTRRTNPNIGSAYVFNSSGGGWTQQAKMTANDRDSPDYLGFGQSVALANDGATAVIGPALDDDPTGLGPSSTYIFHQPDNEWTQQAKLAAEDGDPDDKFGFSVAVSGDGMSAIVGAFRDNDPNGEDAGSAYIFPL